MARLNKTTLFKDLPTQTGRPETPIDKTTRAARDILEHEKEQRDVKTDRLRKARLAHEAATPTEPLKPKRGKDGAGSGK